ncbi:riboflavin synthase, partial [Bartonella bacilliformis]
FDVLIIRHTLEMTTWGQAKVGDQVNLEVDQFARYVARLSNFKIKDE